MEVAFCGNIWDGKDRLEFEDLLSSHSYLVESSNMCLEPP